MCSRKVRGQRGKEARQHHLHRGSAAPSTPRYGIVLAGSLHRSMCSHVCACMYLGRRPEIQAPTAFSAASSHLCRLLACMPAARTYGGCSISLHLCRLLAWACSSLHSPRSILLLTVFLPSQNPFLTAFLYMLGNINTD